MREDVVTDTTAEINNSTTSQDISSALQSGETSIDELIVADQKINKISGRINSERQGFWSIRYNYYVEFSGVDSDVMISNTVTTNNNETITLTKVSDNKYKLSKDIKVGTIIYINYTINGKEYKKQYTVTEV